MSLLSWREFFPKNQNEANENREYGQWTGMALIAHQPHTDIAYISQYHVSNTNVIFPPGRAGNSLGQNEPPHSEATLSGCFPHAHAGRITGVGKFSGFGTMPYRHSSSRWSGGIMKRLRGFYSVWDMAGLPLGHAWASPSWPHVY